MKALKREIFFILLLMVIGIAAVTTNVVVNLTTPINQNPDDFLVYFSNVSVNGTQDLSLVENEKKLVFNGEFSAVGDRKVISYDVTNASKNYDAEILIDCTQSTTYLNITNVFDMKNALSARSTRTGTLTIELSTAVSEEVSQDVTCTISANAVERDALGSGDVGNPVGPSYPVGMEIAIGDELFNVISSTNDTVTMLAQYNLGIDYRQSLIDNEVDFYDAGGWSSELWPNDIDIQLYDGNVKTYVNNYVSYLREASGDATLNGTLITLSDLKSLGCRVNDNYASYPVQNCLDSEYKSWLINGQSSWTRSENSNNPGIVWSLLDDGSIDWEFGGIYFSSGSIRPVITITKEALTKNVIIFTIEGVEYKAYEGMYWSEWVNSPFNTGGFNYYEDEDNFRVYLVDPEYCYNDSLGSDSIIIDGEEYAERYSNEWRD